MRDKRKEDELRNGGDAKYEHLRDQLHVLVEAQGPYDVAQARRAAGVAEIRKMLLPPVSSGWRADEVQPVTVVCSDGLGTSNRKHCYRVPPLAC